MSEDSDSLPNMGFLTFLKKHKIISMAIAAILSERINELVISIVDHLFIPLLEIDINNNKKKDLDTTHIKNITLNVFNAKIKIGEIIISIIKFITVTYTLYVIYTLIQKSHNYITSF